jgi:predicted nucleic acid-binding protein
MFVDTGGWMACADSADPAHESCSATRDAALEAGRLLITTDLVIDETLTLIRFRLGLGAAIAWWQQLDGSARFRCEHIGIERFERARHLFFDFRDEGLSFTDCTSIALMRDFKLTTVLTTDGRFRQLGFEVLPGGRSRQRRTVQKAHDRAGEHHEVSDALEGEGGTGGEPFLRDRASHDQ